MLSRTVVTLGLGNKDLQHSKSPVLCIKALVSDPAEADGVGNGHIQ